MNTDVKFPATGLDLTSYLSSDSIALRNLAVQHGCENCPPPPIYDLSGVTNHSGGMNGGHYIAHVDGRDDPDGRSDDTATSTCSSGSDKDWLCFNDCKISPSSVAACGGSSAYLLFYTRRDTDHATASGSSSSKIFEI